MASNNRDGAEDRVENMEETISSLKSALGTLKTKCGANSQDIDFLQTLLTDHNFMALVRTNDSCSRSQSFKQPEGNAEDCIKGMEMRAPYKTSEETDLMNLLRSPFVKALISVHDTVRSRMYDTPLPAYDPSFHPKTNVQGRRHGQGAAEPRTVGLHKSPNEPLGITFQR
eukprot:Em0012g1041a